MSRYLPPHIDTTPMQPGEVCTELGLVDEPAPPSTLQVVAEDYARRGRRWLEILIALCGTLAVYGYFAWADARVLSHG